MTSQLVQKTNGQAAVPSTSAAVLHALYAPIQDEMAAVEDLLKSEMQSRYPFVDELVRYGVMLGGKRLRPALLLLSAKAVGEITRDHILLAAVMEMIHTATLVHDDVLDQADLRRHLATVNARWDTEASVLLGDYLFSHAFYLASTTSSTVACQLIGRATNIVCEGEIRQKGSKADFGVTEDQYLSIIEGKTAQLCACSCQLGALFASGDESTVARYTEYGRLLGIAFQIADDMLDVVGDESATGKSLGTDLELLKPTLPLIHALQQCSAIQRDELVSLINSPAPDRLSKLMELYERSGSLAYTLAKAHEFADRSRQQIDQLGHGPAYEVLWRLPDFVVRRSG